MLSDCAVTWPGLKKRAGYGNLGMLLIINIFPPARRLKFRLSWEKGYAKISALRKAGI